MKKFCLLFIVALLASCSSSDDASPASSGVLVKKLVQTFEGGGDATITTYHYNGNKLAYALSETDDRKLVYSYDGNLLSDVSYQNLAGVEYSHTAFIYDSSDRLIHLSVSYGDLDTENYVDYTYNSDGTVSLVNHYWDDFEGGYAEQVQKMFLQNGDIVKIETYFPDGTQTNVLTYDGNHNPYANITGFDKILEFNSTGHNNISNILTAADGSVIQQGNTIFTYNGENYPITSIQTGIGSTRTDEYFYE